MRIWFSPYTLKLKNRGDTKVSPQSSRSGALLKIDDSSAVGFADLHPWPEWGDETLEMQLESLRVGKPTRLATRSLCLADLDREARSQGVSAFAGLSIPESHYLVVNPLGSSKDFSCEILRAYKSGFRTFKLKVGRQPAFVLSQLRALVDAFDLSAFPIRWRLDFNGWLKERELKEFINSLPDPIRSQIEFIEDPMAWDEPAWRRLQNEVGVPLALDQPGAGASVNSALSFVRVHAAAEWLPWKVLKPAIEDPQRWLEWLQRRGGRVVVTSYLDHVVGLVGAALEAARLNQNIEILRLSSDQMGRAGLLSHFVYEQDAFSDELSVVGSRLEAPIGTGIGFDRLLEGQPWERLL